MCVCVCVCVFSDYCFVGQVVVLSKGPFLCCTTSFSVLKMNTNRLGEKSCGLAKVWIWGRTPIGRLSAANARDMDGHVATNKQMSQLAKHRA